MKFFADTANLESLTELLDLGLIDGCTTNPLIMAKEKHHDFEAHIKEVARLVKGPVSVEVTTNDYDEMVSQARKFSTWAKNIVVKIPMNHQGLRAVTTLRKEGIKTNVTCCMTTKQAVLAAKAGATYMSLFWGRIEDLGVNARQVVDETREIYDRHKIQTEIIVGSLRNQSHLNEALKSGGHILTIPPDIFIAMIHHPRTVDTINEFLTKWDEFVKGNPFGKQ
ncbi:MAG: transaldolase family protein [Nanoarchaeota archaeon]